MNDSLSMLAIGGLITSVIWLIVLYYVVQSATKSKLLVRCLEVQVRLLMKIAEKNGVSKEDIKESIAS